MLALLALAVSNGTLIGIVCVVVILAVLLYILRGRAG